MVSCHPSSPATQRILSFMRDVILVLVIGAIMPMIIVSPHVGALAYAWLSLMNPHRLTYGFSYGLPFATYIAGLTVIAWLCNPRERKLPAMNAVAWFMVAFAIWICVTTYIALEPVEAAPKFDRTIKIMIGAFVTLILISSRERVIQLTAVVAGSIAFFGIKGGIFTILTGGGARIWGPPATMIEDNNAVALAMNMVVPLIYFLSTQARQRWLRFALMGVVGLCVIAILGTQSRGGMLALAAMGGLLWWRSKNKVAMGAVLVIVAVVAGLLLSAILASRIDAIRNYEEDASAQARLHSWRFAIGVAAERPIYGGGFLVFVRNKKSAEDGPDENGVSESWTNAHSIYFETLGEHGYVGLFILFGLIIGSIITCYRIRSRTAARPDLQWAFELGTALQVSIVGFAIGGAFLNMAFYDLDYYLYVLIIATDTIVRQEVGERRMKRFGQTSFDDEPDDVAVVGGGAQAGVATTSARKSPIRRKQKLLAERSG